VTKNFRCRRFWDLIWISPKVYGCKMATKALAVQQNICNRHRITDPTYTICGVESEDAIFGYTQARDARDVLRDIWRLQDEIIIHPCGTVWFVMVLRRSSKEEQTNLLFLALFD
jgi:hypothetical protein